MGVLTLGVLNGMLAAIALSIAMLLYDLAHPSVSTLGRVGDSHDYVDIARHEDAAPPRGIALFRPNAPLFFANAESVLGVIAARAAASNAPVVVLSLKNQTIWTRPPSMLLANLCWDVSKMASVSCWPAPMIGCVMC
jgi:MFS superfamily sulfate permease-like transporter